MRLETSQKAIRTVMWDCALVGPSEYKLFSPLERLVGLVPHVFRFPQQSEPREGREL